MSKILLDKALLYEIEEKLNSRNHSSFSKIINVFDSSEEDEFLSFISETLNKKNVTFYDLLIKHIDACGFDSDPHFYKTARIEKNTFSNFKKKAYKPKKETVYKCIMALQLNFKDAKELMEKAGHAITTIDNTDIILSACIKRGVYDAESIYEILEFFGAKNIY